jgi:hypothetical protein
LGKFEGVGGRGIGGGGVCGRLFEGGEGKVFWGAGEGVGGIVPDEIFVSVLDGEVCDREAGVGGAGGRVFIDDCSPHMSSSGLGRIENILR